MGDSCVIGWRDSSTACMRQTKFEVFCDKSIVYPNQCIGFVLSPFFGVLDLLEHRRLSLAGQHPFPGFLEDAFRGEAIPGFSTRHPFSFASFSFRRSIGISGLSNAVTTGVTQVWVARPNLEMIKKTRHNTILDLTYWLCDAILICVIGFMMSNNGG